MAREGLLSQSIIKQIPRANVYRWKSEPNGKYNDFGLAKSVGHDLEIIRSFAHDQAAKRVYSGYVRILTLVLSIARSLPDFHRAIKKDSKRIVELTKRVKDVVGLKRTLRFFAISVSTYRNWSMQSANHCFESLAYSCNRVFFNQLSRPEVLKLKALLADNQFQYWPISSIALYALRKGILTLSLNTWYKYVNKFGLVRYRPSSRRKKNEVSVRAERPHQIWHADITRFVTADKVKHYIYVVVDNFSRKILSWSISDTVKAAYRIATLEKALENINDASRQITLITDGGPENKLQKFLETLERPMDHKVALVDVHYSNSLIEAVFKTAKYNYLYKMEIANRQYLEKALSMLVDDFNNRPHISLNGLTPNEAVQNLSINREEVSLKIKKATEERRKYNSNHLCLQCQR